MFQTPLPMVATASIAVQFGADVVAAACSAEP